MASRPRTRSSLAALGVAAVLGLLAWLATREERGPDAVSESPEPATRPSGPPAVPALAGSAPAQAEGEALASAASRETARAEPTTPAPIAEADAPTLRGRFLLPSGAPAVGVRVRVHGWGGNSERLLAHGKPRDWRDPDEATTDDAGRFAFRFDPPPAFQFTLDAGLAGYVTLKWRWSSLPRGETTDVGSVTLVESGSVAGRLVDSKGRPVTGAWRVYAESGFRTQGPGGDATRASVPLDPSTARFRFDDLPPGPVKLEAYSRISNWIGGPTVTVKRGEAVEADVVYDGPDNARRIVVIPFTNPFHPIQPTSDSITLRRGGGGEAPSKKIAGSSQSYAFDELESDSYLVEIRDPRFLPWSREGVAPGTSIDAHLKGSASVALRVVDAATGAPVEPYRVKVRFRNVNFSPSVFGIREPSAPPPSGGLYEGLVPGDLTFVVDAPGFATSEVDADKVGPSESRNVEVRLGRGARLTAIVRDGAGGPVVAGARLELHRELTTADVDLGDAARDRHRGAASDAEGRAVLEGIPPGTYRVLARLNDAVSAERRGVALTEGGAEEIELAFPPSGFLEGRVSGAGDARLDALRIVCERRRTPGESADRRRSFFDDPPTLSAPLDSTGAFRLGPHPEADVVVKLTLEGRTVSTGIGSVSSHSASSAGIALGTASIRGGRTTRQDFELGDRALGYFRITVSVDGAPAAGYVVDAKRATSGPDPDAWGQLSTAVGSDGLARLGPAFGGTWEVTVRPPSREWTSSTLPIRVPPGGEDATALDVTFSSGSFQVVDAEDGAPLADRWIRVAGMRSKADGEGRVTFKLPPGTHEVRDDGTAAPGRVSAALPVRLEWSESGPASAVVRVRKAREIVVPGADGR